VTSLSNSADKLCALASTQLAGEVATNVWTRDEASGRVALSYTRSTLHTHTHTHTPLFYSPTAHAQFTSTKFISARLLQGS